LGSIRRYTEADADRLRFIKRAQTMGFTLAEIVSLLDLQKRRRSCHATRELAAAKLGLVEARIRELRHLRRELAVLVAECDANAEEGACPVIDRLTQRPRGRKSQDRGSDVY
jgi:MerR family mercuric resistance operon transcriptional regulator